MLQTHFLMIPISSTNTEQEGAESNDGGQIIKHDELFYEALVGSTSCAALLCESPELRNKFRECRKKVQECELCQDRNEFFYRSWDSMCLGLICVVLDSTGAVTQKKDSTRSEERRVGKECR